MGHRTVVTVLVASMLVACALAWQAVTAARQRQAASDAMLRHYAQLAAWEFAREARRDRQGDLAPWISPRRRRLRDQPFGVLEVMARVAALLRRAHRQAALKPVERFGAIAIDRDTRTVTRAGTPVDLAPLEFDLLAALVARRGAAASRLELLRDVWGHSAAVVTRTVDTHVAELRRKLEDNPAQPAHILTVRKIGYRLAGGPPATTPSA